MIQYACTNDRVGAPRFVERRADLMSPCDESVVFGLPVLKPMLFPVGDHVFEIRTGVRLWLPYRAMAVITAGPALTSLSGFEYQQPTMIDWENHDVVSIRCKFNCTEETHVPAGQHVVFLRVTSIDPLSGTVEERL